MGKEVLDVTPQAGNPCARMGAGNACRIATIGATGRNRAYAGESPLLPRRASAFVALAVLGASYLGFGAYVPPADGLNFHLDAFGGNARVVTNAAGYVTEWQSKAGISGYTFNRHDNKDGDGLDCLPYYRPAAFGGRGAVRFGYALDGTTKKCTYLGGSGVAKNRHVFIVYNWVAVHTYNQIFGNYGGDTGLRVSTLNNRFPNDDLGVYRLNGVQLDTQGYLVNNSSVGEKLVLSLVANDDQVATSGTKFWCVPGIGSYWVSLYGYNGDRWSCSEIAEVLSYDTALSDADARDLEAYLAAKWQSDYLWTGGGDGTSWNDAANWLGGAVPGPTGTIAILGGAAITVSEDVRAGRIVSDGATISVSAGRTFVCAMKDEICGGTVAFAGDGAVELYGTDLPVTGGLVCHLDASMRSTITCDETGHVTAWKSRSGGVGFAADTVSSYDQQAPLYVEADDHPTARPAVLFGYANTNVAYNSSTDNKVRTYLKSDGVIKPRTMFLLVRPFTYMTKSYDPPFSRKPWVGTSYGTLYSRLNRYVEGLDRVYNNEERTWQWGTPPHCAAAGGRFYVDGVKRYDHDSPVIVPEGFSFEGTLGTDLHLLTIVAGSGRADSWLNFNDWTLGAGYVSAGRYYAGTISEVAMYDRELTDAEREAVERTILKRYFGTTWIGGASGSWSDPANWSDHTVPDHTKYVTIEDASVAVDANANAGVLELRNATLEIAAGRNFGVERLDPASSGNAVSVGSGARFMLTVQTTTPLAGFPGTIAGTGTFVKRGRGAFACTAGLLPSTMALSVDDGEFDLAGNDMAFTAVHGGGRIVNRAETAATITVRNDGATVFEPQVGERVVVRKEGAGEMALSSEFGGTAIQFAGGVCSVVSNLAVSAMAGVVCHLDASRADTIDRDAVTGEVTEWRSLVGNNLAFRKDLYNARETTFGHGAPRYLPTFMEGGRPCVYFGFDNAGNPADTYLRANHVFTNKCHFIVMMPKASADRREPFDNDECIPQSAGPWGQIWTPLHPAAQRSMATQTGWGGSVNVNGKVGNSGKGEAADLTLYSNYAGHSRTMPHVLYSADDGAGSMQPIVGGFYCAYADSGRNWHNGGRFFVGAICEMIEFDRVVSDEEREKIIAMLLTKWGIPPEAEQAFPGAFASNGMDVSFSAAATSLPKLAVPGDLDVTGWRVVLDVGDVNATLVEATGTITAPFAAVSGGGQLKYAPSAIRLTQSLVIIIR